MSITLTTSESYENPVKYKLTILKPDESATVWEFNSFDTSNAPFALTDIAVDLAIGQTGSFAFRINDTKDRVLADSVDCGCVAIIQGAKKESSLQNLMIGIIDDINDDYPIGDQVIYNMSGLGLYTILNYTILNCIKSANKEDLVGTESVPIRDKDFRIDNLALDCFQSTDALPISNSPTLETRGNYDLSNIANSIKEYLPSINFSYATAATIFEHLAASSGRVLWVGPNREVIFRQPQKKHSGITIRQWDKSRINDNARYTAYYDGGWSSHKMMKVDQGFFNRVFLTINTDDILTSSPGTDTTDFTSLDNKDLGVQFIPGSTNLTNLALMLSKTGTGRSTVDDAYNLTGVQGAIVKDDGSNHPSSKIIAKFVIPYDVIETTPTVVYRIDLQYLVRNLDTSFPHWILLFKRGETGESTIRWHHDSDFLTASTPEAPRYNALKTPFTPQPNPTGVNNFQSGFNTDSTGPVYRYSFFATKNTTIAVDDPISIRKYTPGRPVEVRINAPWIKDLKTGFKYANTLLQYGAKLKRIYEKKQVSIPSKLFFPLQLVSIIYPPAGIDANTHTTAEINSVHYEASAYNEQSPFGSKTVQLTATGYINHYQSQVKNSICV